jgi:hypothetical protein
MVDIKIGFGDCANIDVLALFAFPSQWTLPQAFEIPFFTHCLPLIYILVILFFLDFTATVGRINEWSHSQNGFFVQRPWCGILC